MTTDTRTPAEIEYDRLALSTRPTHAQPEAPAMAAPAAPESTEAADPVQQMARELAKDIIATYGPKNGAKILALAEDGNVSDEELEHQVALIEARQKSWAERNPPESFGSLRDGTPIEGHTDDTDPTGRCGVVSVDIGDWRLTAQDEVNLIDIEGENVRIEGASIEEINALRALLATDAPEQLLAAAVSYGRGDAQPPRWPTAPVIVVETWQEDGATYTDYSIGTGLTSVKIGDYDGQKAGIELIIGGCGINEYLSEVITLADVHVLCANLQRLLADPRVQAA